AITFVTSREKGHLRAVEFLIRQKIPRGEVPRRSGRGEGRDRIRKRIDFDEHCDPFGMVTFELDIGKKDGLTLTDLVHLFTSRAKVREGLLGDIRMEDNRSLVQVHKSAGMNVVKNLGAFKYGSGRYHARLVTRRDGEEG
ncbi:MAG: DbpA RNA binding domain-containing protein, partial [Thermoplasmata archaeon]|nr:DbpA RNA binding domain-containing protein [Thermoplasmata archaeon]